MTSTATQPLAQTCITANQAQGSKRMQENIHPAGTGCLHKNQNDYTLSYLLQLATLGAHEGQRMILVDVCDDRSHAVPVLREDGDATHHLRHAQGGIHIQATEVVING